MSAAVLKSEQLREILGCSRDADVRRILERQGIACFDGKDGVWTTYDLIELAGKVKLGLVKAEGKDPIL